MLALPSNYSIQDFEGLPKIPWFEKVEKITITEGQKSY